MTTWHEEPLGHIEPLQCPCCTPTTIAAPIDTDTVMDAYDTPTLNATQFASWARIQALETASLTPEATLGEHIDLLILKLRAITDGDEPINPNHIPDAL